MGKLRRGQRCGCPDLWAESGGEDKIIAGLSGFGNLKNKISWNSHMWGDLAGMIFDDKSVKKRKWLYTVWHEDRKSVRTRTLLRNKSKNVSSFHCEANTDNCDKMEEDTEKVFWKSTCENVSYRDTEANDRETHEEEAQEDTDVIPEETIADPLKKVSQIDEDRGAEKAKRTKDNDIEYPDDTLFCVCRQPNDPNEPYAQCCLCKDWFHPICVGYESVDDISVISPWYCPSCSTIQKKDSEQMDSVRKSLSFENELPSCPPNFSISLTREEWSAIKPLEREGYRMLRKGWTDIMTDKIGSINKSCVLAFKFNKVKSSKSRKAKTRYWRGKAVCKFSGCANYLLSIQKDPDTTTGDIIVNVTVDGKVMHSCDEQHARHCREPGRQKIKDKLGELTPMLLHTKQLASADEEKLLSGNLNDVKSIQVLQKISSEKNLDNRLDRDVFIECFELQQKLDVEEPSSKLKHSSIQYIAMSPFIVHSYSQSQLEILKDLQRSNSCLLYLDATGSVVAKPHPASQSVLYYALCMSCQSTTKTVVPVAEMISADQTTATILHWLTCLRRDFYKLFQRHLKPQKLETDFSWAMIHAVIQAFNTMTVQEYLKVCFRFCQENDKVQVTVIHLCAAHMLKLVSMKLTKMQCKKDTKRFFLYCFALLQNTTTFSHILLIIKCMAYTFSARKSTEGCQKHLSALKDAINTQNADHIKVEMADEEENPADFEDLTKSISKSSPLFAPIEGVVRQAQQEAEEDDMEEKGLPNPYYCESLSDVLLHYAGVVPLWTGLMLTGLGKTRDSNAVVENWFRTTKTVILTSKLHRRAGDFLQVQHEFVVGRLKGVTLRKKRVAHLKSNPGTQDTEGPEVLPLTQEEQWKKRTPQKRKSRYYSSPPPQTKKVKLSAPQKERGCCPPWGGKGTIGHKTITMTNTCTIDNLLYTMHLAIKRRSGIENDLQKHSNSDTWISTLLQVHEHFQKKDWEQGKLLWLNQIGRFKGQLWNTFGTEEDMVACRLGFLLNTELIGKCQNPACPVVKKMSNSIEILCEDFGNFQADINKWVSQSIKALPCKSGPNPCTHHQTTQQRTFVHGLPCLLLVSVVHKSFATKTQLPTALPQLVSVLGGKYEPAAITYHLGDKNHFVVFHRLGAQPNWHFYDGLKEAKKPGSGDTPVTNANMWKKLGKKTRVGHVLMVRDKAAETVEERRKKNEELVKFIVDDKGAEDRLRAIVSGEERPHYTFEERWVPIIFDDDAQLDKIIAYLSDFLACCNHLSPEVYTMISRDRIKFILNVLLSEATLQALEEKRSMTRTEAVAEVDQWQMEESERQELIMQIKLEMEKRGLL